MLLLSPLQLSQLSQMVCCDWLVTPVTYTNRLACRCLGFTPLPGRTLTVDIHFPSLPMSLPLDTKTLGLLLEILPLRRVSWERTVSPTTGEKDIPMQVEEIRSLPHNHSEKVNWIKDTNIGAKTMKLLEESRGKSSWYWIWKWFVRYKHQKHK